MKNCLALVALALIAGPVSAEPPESGCRMLAAGKSSPEALDQYYGKRAVRIVELGLAKDSGALKELVDHGFSYQITDADYVFGPVETVKGAGVNGATAAEMLARWLRPKSYRISSPFSMLLITSGRRECDWTVTVVFERTAFPDAVSIEFYFKDDKLVSATGKTLIELKGEMQLPSG